MAQLPTPQPKIHPTLQVGILLDMWTHVKQMYKSSCSSAWMKSHGNAEVCNEYIMIDFNMSDPQILQIAWNT